MSALMPIDLRCEHLFEPQGLNTRQPRFTWALQGSGRNRRQTAYRIVVGSDRNEVEAGHGSHWDSSRVASDESLLIAYAGRRLRSDETLFWTVQAWDEQGVVSGFSSPAMFRTGLMEQLDWTAHWISRSLVPPGGRTPPQDTVYDNPYSARPADYYRREFSLDRKVKRATVYATALGLYELHLNGTVVGDQVLAPGWTDYHKRVEYQSYDVTSLLATGRNAMGAIVGEGWYCGRVALDQKRAGSHYGSRPALICQLHIEYEDGSIEIVGTDASWTCSNEAIVYSDLLLGEKYDARLEQPGWDRPDFDDAAWWGAEETSPLPKAPLIDATRGVPVRRTVEFHAKYLHASGDGKLIFDLSQNIAGYTRLELEAPRDAVFLMRHGEALQPDGQLYTANLRWALATDTYISKGGRQVFEPRFTVHGYRYVELTVPSGTRPEAVKLTGVAVHSDMPVAGTFACGNDMLNQLHSNIVWTQRGNFLSVPTDCPQRDERMGWLGDAQVFFNAAAYNMDTAAFFDKWLVDIGDAQTAEGAFTDVAPSIVYTRFAPNPPRGAPGWGDAGVIIPWRMYERYGDIGVLDRCYDGMVRWLDLIERNNADYVRRNAVFSNWGDWLCLGPATSKPLFGTAYWAYMAEIMIGVAGILGRRQDEARFKAMHRDIRRAFRQAFLQKDGRLESDTQSAYLMALGFGLLDEADRDSALGHLLNSISVADGHIQTGIHGIRLACLVLAECGRADVAYDLLLKKTYPSWGFSIENGATTIWERWDGWTPERGFQSVNMNSLNHYALGAVGEFLYARVAGIEIVPAGAGRRLLLRPLPDRRLGWCRASYTSHAGAIASAWEYQDDMVLWDVTLPANCTASVELPETVTDVTLQGDTLPGIRQENGLKRFDIGSGTYRFALRAS